MVEENWYDPTTSSGTTAIANLSTQRNYTDDAAGSTVGERYIFTYMPTVSSGNWAPNGGTATGTITTGIQTDFVWNDASCSTAGG